MPKKHCPKQLHCTIQKMCQKYIFYHFGKDAIYAISWAPWKTAKYTLTYPGINAFHKVLMHILLYFVNLWFLWVNVNVLGCLAAWQVVLQVSDVSFETVAVILARSLDLESLIHFLLKYLQNTNNSPLSTWNKPILLPPHTLHPINNMVVYDNVVINRVTPFKVHWSQWISLWGILKVFCFSSSPVLSSVAAASWSRATGTYSWNILHSFWKDTNHLFLACCLRRGSLLKMSLYTTLCRQCEMHKQWERDEKDALLTSKCAIQ